MHGMIAFIRGKLVEAYPHQAIVDVNGVGYAANIPLTTFDRLPQQGAEVRLLTHYHITERDHTLFGFFTEDERDLFRLLIDRVSGIGPKMALSVLSGLPVPAFKDAVIRNDTAALAKIKGVGKKTAERIVLELKDKLQEFTVEAAKVPVEADVLSALENLGYPRALAEGATRRALTGDENASFDVLFKRALQILTKE